MTGRRCPPARASGGARRVARRGAPAAALCRLDPDGSITIIDRRRRHERHDRGVPDRSPPRHSAVDPTKVEVVALDTDGAPRSPHSGGSVMTYSSGRAVREAAATTRGSCSRYAAIEMEIDPADLEIVDGLVQPQGCPGPRQADRRARREAVGLRRPFPPVEGHAGAVRPASRRRRRPTSRTSGVDRGDRRRAGPRLRRRAGRRPGAQSGADRGPDARRRRAGHRLGVARGDASTTTRASCCRARSSTTRCRVPATGPGHRDASSSRCRHPTDRSGPRASARRPSAAVPRRSPTPSRTRSARACTGCR